MRKPQIIAKVITDETNVKHLSQSNEVSYDVANLDKVSYWMKIDENAHHVIQPPTWLPPCPWQGNKPSLPLPSLTPIESKQYPLDGFRI